MMGGVEKWWFFLVLVLIFPVNDAAGRGRGRGVPILARLIDQGVLNAGDRNQNEILYPPPLRFIPSLEEAFRVYATRHPFRRQLLGTLGASQEKTRFTLEDLAAVPYFNNFLKVEFMKKNGETDTETQTQHSSSASTVTTPPPTIKYEVDYKAAKDKTPKTTQTSLTPKAETKLPDEKNISAKNHREIASDKITTETTKQENILWRNASETRRQNPSTRNEDIENENEPNKTTEEDNKENISKELDQNATKVIEESKNTQNEELNQGKDIEIKQTDEREETRESQEAKIVSRRIRTKVKENLDDTEKVLNKEEVKEDTIRIENVGRRRGNVKKIRRVNDNNSDSKKEQYKEIINDQNQSIKEHKTNEPKQEIETTANNQDQKIKEQKAIELEETETTNATPRLDKIEISNKNEEAIKTPKTQSDEEKQTEINLSTTEVSNIETISNSSPNTHILKIEQKPRRDGTRNVRRKTRRRYDSTSASTIEDQENKTQDNKTKRRIQSNTKAEENEEYSRKKPNIDIRPTESVPILHRRRGRPTTTTTEEVPIQRRRKIVRNRKHTQVKNDEIKQRFEKVSKENENVNRENKEITKEGKEQKELQTIKPEELIKKQKLESEGNEDENKPDFKGINNQKEIQNEEKNAQTELNNREIELININIKESNIQKDIDQTVGETKEITTQKEIRINKETEEINKAKNKDTKQSDNNEETILPRRRNRKIIRKTNTNINPIEVKNENTKEKINIKEEDSAQINLDTKLQPREEKINSNEETPQRRRIKIRRNRQNKEGNIDDINRQQELKNREVEEMNRLRELENRRIEEIDTQRELENRKIEEINRLKELKNREDEEKRRQQELQNRNIEEINRQKELENREKEEMIRQQELKIRENEEKARREELKNRQIDEINRQEELERRQEEEVIRQQELKNREIEEINRIKELENRENEEIIRQQELLNRTNEEISRKKETLNRENEEIRRKEEDVNREKELTNREREELLRQQELKNRHIEETNRENEEVIRQKELQTRQEEEIRRQNITRNEERKPLRNRNSASSNISQRRRVTHAQRRKAGSNTNNETTHRNAGQNSSNRNQNKKVTLVRKRNGGKQTTELPVAEEIPQNSHTNPAGDANIRRPKRGKVVEEESNKKTPEITKIEETNKETNEEDRTTIGVDKKVLIGNKESEEINKPKNSDNNEGLILLRRRNRGIIRNPRKEKTDSNEETPHRRRIKIPRIQPNKEENIDDINRQQELKNREVEEMNRLHELENRKIEEINRQRELENRKMEEMNRLKELKDEEKRRQQELENRKIEEINRQKELENREKEEMIRQQELKNRENEEKARQEELKNRQIDEINRQEELERRQKEEVIRQQELKNREIEEINRIKELENRENEEITRQQELRNRTNEEISRKKESLNRENEEIRRKEEDVNREKELTNREREELLRQQELKNRHIEEINRENEEVARQKELQTRQEEEMRRQNITRNEERKPLRNRNSASSNNNQRRRVTNAQRRKGGSNTNNETTHRNAGQNFSNRNENKKVTSVRRRNGGQQTTELPVSEEIPQNSHTNPAGDANIRRTKRGKVVEEESNKKTPEIIKIEETNKETNEEDRITIGVDTKVLIGNKESEEINKPKNLDTKNADNNEEIILLRRRNREIIRNPREEKTDSNDETPHRRRIKIPRIRPNKEENIDDINRQQELKNREVEEMNRLRELENRRIEEINRQRELENRKIEEINRLKELKNREDEEKRRQQELENRKIEEINRQKELENREKEEMIRQQELKNRENEEKARQEELRNRQIDEINRQEELEMRQKEEVIRQQELKNREIEEINRIKELENRENEEIIRQQELRNRTNEEINRKKESLNRENEEIRRKEEDVNREKELTNREREELLRQQELKNRHLEETNRENEEVIRQKELQTRQQEEMRRQNITRNEERKPLRNRNSASSNSSQRRRVTHAQRRKGGSKTNNETTNRNIGQNSSNENKKVTSVRRRNGGQQTTELPVSEEIPQNSHTNPAGDANIRRTKRGKVVEEESNKKTPDIIKIEETHKETNEEDRTTIGVDKKVLIGNKESEEINKPKNLDTKNADNNEEIILLRRRNREIVRNPREEKTDSNDETPHRRRIKIPRIRPNKEENIDDINRQQELKNIEVEEINRLRELENRRIEEINRQRELENRKIEEINRLKELKNREDEEKRRQQELENRKIEEINRQKELENREKEEMIRQQELKNRENEEKARQEELKNRQIDEINRQEELERRQKEEVIRQQELKNREIEEINRIKELENRENEEIIRQQELRNRTNEEISRKKETLNRENEEIRRKEEDVNREKELTNREREELLRQQELKNRHIEETNRENEEVIRQKELQTRQEEEIRRQNITRNEERKPFRNRNSASSNSSQRRRVTHAQRRKGGSNTNNETTHRSAGQNSSNRNENKKVTSVRRRNGGQQTTELPVAEEIPQNSHTNPAGDANIRRTKRGKVVEEESNKKTPEIIKIEETNKETNEEDRITMGVDTKVLIGNKESEEINKPKNLVTKNADNNEEIILLRRRNREIIRNPREEKIDSNDETPHRRRIKIPRIRPNKEEIIDDINIQQEIKNREVEEMNRLQELENRRIEEINRQRELENRKIEEINRLKELKNREDEDKRRQQELENRKIEEINRQKELENREKEEIIRQQELKNRENEEKARQEELKNRQIDEINRHEELERREKEEVIRQQELKNREIEEIKRIKELENRENEEIIRQEELRNRTNEEINRKKESLNRENEEIRRKEEDVNREKELTNREREELLRLQELKNRHIEETNRENEEVIRQKELQTRQEEEMRRQNITRNEERKPLRNRNSASSNSSQRRRVTHAQRRKGGSKTNNETTNRNIGQNSSNENKKVTSVRRRNGGQQTTELPGSEEIPQNSHTNPAGDANIRRTKRGKVVEEESNKKTPEIIKIKETNKETNEEDKTTIGVDTKVLIGNKESEEINKPKNLVTKNADNNEEIILLRRRNREIIRNPREEKTDSNDETPHRRRIKIPRIRPNKEENIDDINRQQELKNREVEEMNRLRELENRRIEEINRQRELENRKIEEINRLKELKNREDEEKRRQQELENRKIEEINRQKELENREKEEMIRQQELKNRENEEKARQEELRNRQIDEINRQEELERRQKEEVIRQQELKNREIEEINRIKELENRENEEIIRQEELRNRTNEEINRKKESLNRENEEIRRKEEDVNREKELTNREREELLRQQELKNRHLEEMNRENEEVIRQQELQTRQEEEMRRQNITRNEERKPLRNRNSPASNSNQRRRVTHAQRRKGGSKTKNETTHRNIGQNSSNENKKVTSVRRRNGGQQRTELPVGGEIPQNSHTNPSRDANTHRIKRGKMVNVEENKSVIEGSVDSTVNQQDIKNHNIESSNSAISKNDKNGNLNGFEGATENSMVFTKLKPEHERESSNEEKIKIEETNKNSSQQNGEDVKSTTRSPIETNTSDSNEDENLPKRRNRKITTYSSVEIKVIPQSKENDFFPVPTLMTEAAKSLRKEDFRVESNIEHNENITLQELKLKQNIEILTQQTFGNLDVKEVNHNKELESKEGEKQDSRIEKVEELNRQDELKNSTIKEINKQQEATINNEKENRANMNRPLEQVNRGNEDLNTKEELANIKTEGGINSKQTVRINSTDGSTSSNPPRNNQKRRRRKGRGRKSSLPKNEESPEILQQTKSSSSGINQNKEILVGMGNEEFKEVPPQTQNPTDFMPPNIGEKQSIHTTLEAVHSITEDKNESDPPKESINLKIQSSINEEKNIELINNTPTRSITEGIEKLSTKNIENIQQTKSDAVRINETNNDNSTPSTFFNKEETINIDTPKEVNATFPRKDESQETLDDQIILISSENKTSDLNKSVQLASQKGAIQNSEIVIKPTANILDFSQNDETYKIKEVPNLETEHEEVINGGNKEASRRGRRLHEISSISYSNINLEHTSDKVPSIKERKKDRVANEEASKREEIKNTPYNDLKIETQNKTEGNIQRKTEGSEIASNDNNKNLGSSTNGPKETSVRSRNNRRKSAQQKISSDINIKQTIDNEKDVEVSHVRRRKPKQHPDSARQVTHGRRRKSRYETVDLQQKEETIKPNSTEDHIIVNSTNSIQEKNDRASNTRRRTGRRKTKNKNLQWNEEAELLHTKDANNLGLDGANKTEIVNRVSKTQNLGEDQKQADDEIGKQSGIPLPYKVLDKTKFNEEIFTDVFLATTENAFLSENDDKRMLKDITTIKLLSTEAHIAQNDSKIFPFIDEIVEGMHAKQFPINVTAIEENNKNINKEINLGQKTNADKILYETNIKNEVVNIDDYSNNNTRVKILDEETNNKSLESIDKNQKNEEEKNLNIPKTTQNLEKIQITKEDKDEESGATKISSAENNSKPIDNEHIEHTEESIKLPKVNTNERKSKNNKDNFSIPKEGDNKGIEELPLPYKTIDFKTEAIKFIPKTEGREDFNNAEKTKMPLIEDEDLKLPNKSTNTQSKTNLERKTVQVEQVQFKEEQHFNTKDENPQNNKYIQSKDNKDIDINENATNVSETRDSRNKTLIEEYKQTEKPFISEDKSLDDLPFPKESESNINAETGYQTSSISPLLLQTTENILETGVENIDLLSNIPNEAGFLLRRNSARNLNTRIDFRRDEAGRNLIIEVPIRNTNNLNIKPSEEDLILGKENLKTEDQIENKDTSNKLINKDFTLQEDNTEILSQKVNISNENDDTMNNKTSIKASRSAGNEPLRGVHDGESKIKDGTYENENITTEKPVEEELLLREETGRSTNRGISSEQRRGTRGQRRFEDRNNEEINLTALNSKQKISSPTVNNSPIEENANSENNTNIEELIVTETIVNEDDNDVTILNKAEMANIEGSREEILDKDVDGDGNYNKNIKANEENGFHKNINDEIQIDNDKKVQFQEESVTENSNSNRSSLRNSQTERVNLSRGRNRGRGNRWEGSQEVKSVSESSPSKENEEILTTTRNLNTKASNENINRRRNEGRSNRRGNDETRLDDSITSTTINRGFSHNEEVRLGQNQETKILSKENIQPIEGDYVKFKENNDGLSSTGHEKTGRSRNLSKEKHDINSSSLENTSNNNRNNFREDTESNVKEENVINKLNSSKYEEHNVSDTSLNIDSLAKINEDIITTSNGTYEDLKTNAKEINENEKVDDVKFHSANEEKRKTISEKNNIENTIPASHFPSRGFNSRNRGVSSNNRRNEDSNINNNKDNANIRQNENLGRNRGRSSFQSRNIENEEITTKPIRQRGRNIHQIQEDKSTKHEDNPKRSSRQRGRNNYQSEEIIHRRIDEEERVKVTQQRRRNNNKNHAEATTERAETVQSKRQRGRNNQQNEEDVKSKTETISRTRTRSRNENTNEESAPKRRNSVKFQPTEEVSYIPSTTTPTPKVNSNRSANRRRRLKSRVALLVAKPTPAPEFFRIIPKHLKVPPPGVRLPRLKLNATKRSKRDVERNWGDVLGIENREKNKFPLLKDQIENLDRLKRNKVIIEDVRKMEYLNGERYNLERQEDILFRKNRDFTKYEEPDSKRFKEDMKDVEVAGEYHNAKHEIVENSSDEGFNNISNENNEEIIDHSRIYAGDGIRRISEDDEDIYVQNYPRRSQRFRDVKNNSNSRKNYSGQEQIIRNRRRNQNQKDKDVPKFSDYKREGNSIRNNRQNRVRVTNLENEKRDELIDNEETITKTISKDINDVRLSSRNIRSRVKETQKNNDDTNNEYKNNNRGNQYAANKIDTSKNNGIKNSFAINKDEETIREKFTSINEQDDTINNKKMQLEIIHQRNEIRNTRRGRKNEKGLDFQNPIVENNVDDQGYKIYGGKTVTTERNRKLGDRRAHPKNIHFIDEEIKLENAKTEDSIKIDNYKVSDNTNGDETNQSMNDDQTENPNTDLRSNKEGDSYSLRSNKEDNNAEDSYSLRREPKAENNFRSSAYLSNVFDQKDHTILTFEQNFPNQPFPIVNYQPTLWQSTYFVPAYPIRRPSNGIVQTTRLPTHTNTETPTKSTLGLSKVSQQNIIAATTTPKIEEDEENMMMGFGQKLEVTTSSYLDQNNKYDATITKDTTHKNHKRPTTQSSIMQGIRTTTQINRRKTTTQNVQIITDANKGEVNNNKITEIPFVVDNDKLTTTAVKYTVHPRTTRTKTTTVEIPTTTVPSTTNLSKDETDSTTSAETTTVFTKPTTSRSKSTVRPRTSTPRNKTTKTRAKVTTVANRRKTTPTPGTTNRQENRRKVTRTPGSNKNRKNRTSSTIAENYQRVNETPRKLILEEESQQRSTQLPKITTSDVKNYQKTRRMTIPQNEKTSTYETTPIPRSVTDFNTRKVNDRNYRRTTKISMNEGSRVDINRKSKQIPNSETETVTTESNQITTTTPIFETTVTEITESTIFKNIVQLEASKTKTKKRIPTEYSMEEVSEMENNVSIEIRKNRNNKEDKVIKRGRTTPKIGGTQTTKIKEVDVETTTKPYVNPRHGRKPTGALQRNNEMENHRRITPRRKATNEKEIRQSDYLSNNDDEEKSVVGAQNDEDIHKPATKLVTAETSFERRGNRSFDGSEENKSISENITNRPIRNSRGRKKWRSEIGSN